MVGGTLSLFRTKIHINIVSVLSVEPWLVELNFVNNDALEYDGFSALSRAVVGGTSFRV